MVIFFLLLSSFILGLNRICKLITFKFLINYKLWLVSIVTNIIQLKKYIIVITSTSTGKNYSYQFILLIISGIILIVSSTITLIENHVSSSLFFIIHSNYTKFDKKVQLFL